jgi:hypothetical protein
MAIGSTARSFICRSSKIITYFQCIINKIVYNTMATTRNIYLFAFHFRSSQQLRLYKALDLARAQAVSHWLPTAATWVRVRVEHVGFVMDRVALGQVFSEYFGFLCQPSFHKFLHYHNHPGLAQ